MQRVVALKKLAFEQAQFDGYLVFNQSNLTYFIGVQGATALFIPKDDEGTVYVYGVNYEQTCAAVKNFSVGLVGRGEDLMTKIARTSR